MIENVARGFYIHDKSLTFHIDWQMIKVKNNSSPAGATHIKVILLLPTVL